MLTHSVLLSLPAPPKTLRNLLKLSTHQQNLAIIVESLTLLTLCTLFHDAGSSTLYLSILRGVMPWSSLWVAITLALQRTIVSTPVIILVQFMLLCKPEGEDDDAR